MLAFYFTRQNFEAAARSIATVATAVTPDERLRSVAVRDKAIPIERMFYRSTPASSINLRETLAELTSAGKGERVPVLDDKTRAPVYIVHRSRIDKFLAAALGTLLADPSADPSTVEKLTLADMLTDPHIRQELEASWAVVAEGATLADAKRAMEQTPGCQDVFVTKTGKREEPVIAWITNAILEENSRV